MTGTGCEIYARLGTIAATPAIEIRAQRVRAHDVKWHELGEDEETAAMAEFHVLAGGWAV